MSFNPSKDDECFLTTQKHNPCIEFVLGEQKRHGFHSSQLLHYRLEADEEGSSPMTLTIAFATADVVVTGFALGRIADRLRDGDLLLVRTVPSRYAGMARSRCHVTGISIQPVEKV